LTAPSRLIRREASAIWFALAIACAACTPTQPFGRDDVGPGVSAGVANSTPSGVFAPVDGDGQRELARVRRGPGGPNASLREAYLLQERGDHGGSLRVLNRLIFGNVQYGPAVEAYARYLRARAFDRTGETERAAHERQLAGELAIDEELRRRLELIPRPNPVARVAESPVAHVEILARAAWRADPAAETRMTPMGRITRITVHHSANLTRATDLPSTRTAIRAIQRYHQREQGWGDIGYHYLIDPAGRVWAGRSARWQGAHAGDGDKNRQNLGICLLGDFVPGSQGQPPAPQIRALALLVAELCRVHGVRAGNVLTHQEIKATSCPGPYVQAAVQRIRDELGNVGPVAAQ
jgi:hypothetical protein